MRKGLCLVIAIVLASAALVACSNDSATTQQTPGVTEPAPTAEPTSTPTVVPTPMPTANADTHADAHGNSSGGPHVQDGR